MFKDLLNYKDYSILIEDPKTLQFTRITNVTDDVLKNFKIYEVDHTEKVIYLEPVKHDSYILIATDDELQLPLYVAKNYNEAAAFMNVTATHLYRAHRRAGRPQQLKYNNYILIKI